MLKGASRLETCKPRGLRRGLHQEQTIMPALGQCFLILVDPSCLVFSFQSSSVSNGNPTDSPRQSSFLHFLADFRCMDLKRMLNWGANHVVQTDFRNTPSRIFDLGWSWLKWNKEPEHIYCWTWNNMETPGSTCSPPKKIQWNPLCHGFKDPRLSRSALAVPFLLSFSLTLRPDSTHGLAVRLWQDLRQRIQQLEEGQMVEILVDAMMETNRGDLGLVLWYISTKKIFSFPKDDHGNHGCS